MRRLLSSLAGVSSDALPPDVETAGAPVPPLWCRPGRVFDAELGFRRAANDSCVAVEAVDPFTCPIPGKSSATRQPAEEETLAPVAEKDPSAMQPRSERPVFSAPPTAPTSSATIGQAGAGGAQASTSIRPFLPAPMPLFVASDDVTAGVIPPQGSARTAVDSESVAQVGQGAGTNGSVRGISSHALRGGLVLPSSAVSPAEALVRFDHHHDLSLRHHAGGRGAHRGHLRDEGLRD